MSIRTKDGNHSAPMGNPSPFGERVRSRRLGGTYLSVLGLLLAGAALGWSVNRQARDLEVGELRATWIAMVDESGKARAVLQHREQTTTLSFLDAEGRVRVRLCSGPENRDRAGKSQLQGLAILGPSGTGNIELAITDQPPSTEYVSIKADDERGSRILLSMENGAPGVRVESPAGEEVFRVPQPK